MRILKKENTIYVVIIFIVWMIIAIRLYVNPDRDERNSNISLTEVKFIDTRRRMDNVPEDTVVNFYYGIVNVGNNNLKIEYINPDCSCTKCYAIDSIIVPGDSSMIVMKFNTAHKLGFHKLNSIVKLNTLAGLYKISAIVEVVDK